MSGLSVDVTDFNKLTADLNRAGPLALRKISQLVKKTIFDTQRDAQAFCPVETGNLRNSFVTEFISTGSSFTGLTGPTAEYGEYVELGTSRQAPAAYVGPAVDRNTPPFVSALTALAGDLL